MKAVVRYLPRFSFRISHCRTAGLPPKAAIGGSINREISDIWMRGNAGEPLDHLEEFRYKQVAKEMYRLSSQNYQQYSTIDGAPADWAIWQLARAANGNPRLKAVIMEQLDRPGRLYSTLHQNFKDRIRELDPPEFRKEIPEN